MTQRGAALKKLADAAGPLYKSLDEAQKHRFIVLARLGGARTRVCTGSAAGCIAARAASGAARWVPTAARGRSRPPRREAGTAAAAFSPTRQGRRILKPPGARRLFLCEVDEGLARLDTPSRLC